MVIAALQSNAIAARPRHEIEIERKVKRAAEVRHSRRHCGPVRRAPDDSPVGADIPAVPVVTRDNRRRRSHREVRRERRRAEDEHAEADDD